MYIVYICIDNSMVLCLDSNVFSLEDRWFDPPLDSWFRGLVFRNQAYVWLVTSTSMVRAWPRQSPKHTKIDFVTFEKKKVSKFVPRNVRASIQVFIIWRDNRAKWKVHASLFLYEEKPGWNSITFSGKNLFLKSEWRLISVRREPSEMQRSWLRFL